MRIILILLGSICVGYGIMATIAGKRTPIFPDKTEQRERDTIYIDSFLIPFPVQVPIIEIPHPEHGRMIVNLNDSTIILTASGIVLVEFKDQDMINKYLYQQFNGQNINRKGE